VIAIGLVVMVLWGLGKLPVEQIGQEVTGVKAKVAGLVQVLGPAPTAETPKGASQTVARATATISPTIAVTEDNPEAGSESELTEIAENTEETFAEPSATTAVSATLEVPSPGAQAITATVATVPTLTPTSTPAPTATAVPPTATQPAPTATIAATKAAGSQANSHRVRAGDTLSGIAQQYQVSLDALLAANRMPAATMLRIGQELVIPGAGVPPAPTATPRPRVTPTPTALPPTPAPHLPAPILIGPGDKASSTGEAEQILLQWNAVPGMSADDKYQVLISWYDEFGERREYYWFTPSIEQRVPTWLWGKARQPERQYQWSVRAAQLSTDGQGGELIIPLSPDSEIRTFYWN
jgi:LysM repeat protein